MLSHKQWSVEAVARLFMAIIATLCFGISTAGVVELFKFGLNEDNRHFLEMAIVSFSFQIAALVWVRQFLRDQNLTWQAAFGFGSGNSSRITGLAFMATLIVLPVALELQSASAAAMDALHISPVAQPVVVELQKPGLATPEKIFFGIIAIVIAPIAEEIIFRGILYPTIKQHGHPLAALWATSLLFGLVHFSMVTFVPLSLLAFVLALLYEATDNLLCPILTHSLFNTANFLILVCNLDTHLPFVR